MRYYEVTAPGAQVRCTTTIRNLRELPEGTTIVCVVTDRDGGALDSWAIPVVEGKPKFGNRAKHRAKRIGRI
jgi:hypothetical protein